MNGARKDMFDKIIFNATQSPDVLAAQGINLVNALKLLMTNNINEAMEELEEDIKINKSENQQMQGQQSQAEQQAQMQAQQQAIMLEAQMQQLKEDNNNWRTSQTNETKLLLQQNQSIIDSLQLLLQGKPDNPILNPPQQSQSPAQPQVQQ
jgi:hypothetical protein